jgi:hypothetical protein
MVNGSILGIEEFLQCGFGNPDLLANTDAGNSAAADEGICCVEANAQNIGKLLNGENITKGFKHR